MCSKPQIEIIYTDIGSDLKAYLEWIEFVDKLLIEKLKELRIPKKYFDEKI